MQHSPPYSTFGRICVSSSQSVLTTSCQYTCKVLQVLIEILYLTPNLRVCSDTLQFWTVPYLLYLPSNFLLFAVNSMLIPTILSVEPKVTYSSHRHVHISTYSIILKRITGCPSCKGQPVSCFYLPVFFLNTLIESGGTVTEI